MTKYPNAETAFYLSTIILATLVSLSRSVCAIVEFFINLDVGL